MTKNKAYKNSLSRLREVFRHWVSAAEGYLDPEDFRIALNACIQSARNVTFILQKNKSSIENFNSWYGQWQNALKDDPVMVWCVSARNRIVKQGDLETLSIANVSLLTSYNEQPVNVYKVNPFLSGEKIALHIKNKILDKKSIKEGYLKVEKQWISDDLPSIELLSALAHAFSVLHALIDDIEKKIGPKIIYTQNSNQEDIFRAALERLDDNSKSDCMLSFEDYRTTWLKLSTGESEELSQIEIKQETIPKEIKEKYDIKSVKFSNSTNSLEEKVRNLFQVGKRILEKDGYHITTIFTINRKGKAGLIQTVFKDNDEKYLFWEGMAKDVKRNKITTVIVIADAWYAPYDKNNPLQRAHESSKRKEAIQGLGIKKTNETFSIIAPYSRKEGKIVFEEEKVENEFVFNFLNPIKRVWERQNKLKR